MIIDFGSAKASCTTRKQRDDLRNLAGHIGHIANKIQFNGLIKSPNDDAILRACEALLAVMYDDDPMRRPEKASDLLRHFEKNFPRGVSEQNLKHPFDFGNAEEVTDNSLLYKLAARNFPWRDKIESSANLLVIGPRGCGKTTVFRSMSFNCLADADQIEDALSRTYLGLYVSCNKDFRQRFSAIDKEVLASRGGEIRHYFNLLVFRDFVRTLIACNKYNKLAEHDIASLLNFVRTFYQDTSSDAGTIKDTLLLLESYILITIHSVRMNIWNNQPVSPLTTQDFIAELADLVSTSITPFLGKHIFLFVDDYTERKVPREAQRAINHILFVPNGKYKSKISSEVFGVPPDQTFGSFLDQDRDYKEWNIGTLYYLELPRSEQKEFLSSIVDKRLELCNYKGKIKDIIGRSQYPAGTLARSLKEEAEARIEARSSRKGIPEGLIEEEIEIEIKNSQKKTYYHGWDTICDLCTGDVSNILELLNRMYEVFEIGPDMIEQIDKNKQSSVIERYSQQYLAKIKGIPRYGEKLFHLVNAFGNMSLQLLREYPWISRASDRRDPYQLIRIEMDETYVASAQDLLGIDQEKVGTQLSAKWLWFLLQRYCIVIDASESRSRRNTLASKVILRRIFCPAFKIGLTNSECYTVSRRDWEAFCYNPEAMAKSYVKRAIEKAKSSRGIEGEQLNIWDIKEDDV